jgi:hypoxanthine-guanine phosphoribosyltransferase
MADKDLDKKPAEKLYANDPELKTQVIADMLRIEQVTSEIKEFKLEVKDHFAKIENWLVGIMAGVFATMSSLIIALIFKLF